MFHGRTRFAPLLLLLLPANPALAQPPGIQNPEPDLITLPAPDPNPFPLESLDPKIPARNRIDLEIRVATTGDEPVKVQIRPGHRACDFEPKTLEIPPGRQLMTHRLPILVQSVSGNRDCTFEFIILEPNRPRKTMLRSVRLRPAPPDAPPPAQEVAYTLNTPSLVERENRRENRIADANPEPNPRTPK